VVTNPARLYICAGLGRTGTTSLTEAFDTAGIEAEHEAGAVHLLIGAAFQDVNGTSRTVRQRFVELVPPNAPPRGLLDIPVNVFVWDLLDAYPNSTIALTTRWVRSKCLLVL
jgi:hypothetical protein